MWAMVSYGGLLVGLPLGAIPLLQRDDAYSLRHGKTATAVWIGMFGGSIILSVLISVIATVTCGIGGILFPLMFLPWLWSAVAGIHGLILTMNGQWDEPLGGFGLGDKLFASLTTKDGEPPLIPPPPPPG